jgi:hypothetical protein
MIYARSNTKRHNNWNIKHIQTERHNYPGPSGTFFTGLIIRDWTICVRARRFNRKKFSDERGG